MKQKWEYKTLGDVVTFINGDRGKNYPSQSDFQESGIPFINAGHLSNGIISFDTMNYISEDKYNNLGSGKVKEGDILFCLRGSLGKKAIVNSIDKGAIASSLVILRCKSILNKFLYYYLDSPIVSLSIGKNDNGSSQPNLSANSVKNFKIPFPDIEVQEKIVTELDLLSGIIEKQKKQLEELDSLAQSIFYDMFGDPHSNEKGWDVKMLGELYDIGSSKRVFENQWTTSGVPFFRAREIVRLSADLPIESPIYISEDLYNDYSQKYGIPSEGDIMVTAVGTLGVCYIVKKSDKFYFKDGNLLCFKNKGLCDSKYIKALFDTEYVKSQIRGNANAAVVGTYTIANAKKTKVLYPPLSLQQEFAEKIETIEAMKEKIRQSLKESEDLFNSRMDYYFN